MQDSDVAMAIPGGWTPAPGPEEPAVRRVGSFRASCRLCAHYAPAAAERERGAGRRRLLAFGQCRRHAPIALPAPTNAAVWPRVKETDWCGEFRWNGLAPNGRKACGMEGETAQEVES